MESYCSKLNLSCSFSIDQMVSHFQIVLPSWPAPGAWSLDMGEERTNQDLIRTVQRLLGLG